MFLQRFHLRYSYMSEETAIGTSRKFLVKCVLFWKLNLASITSTYVEGEMYEFGSAW